MHYSTMSVLTVVLYLVVLAILATIIVFYKNKHLYWKNHGVAYLEPSIPLGNFAIGKHPIDFLNRVYSLKGQTPAVGAYLLWRPVLVPTSLDLIQNVLVKDFQNFSDRGMYTNDQVDPISSHLFALDGDKWKSTRLKLSPAFSAAKMKMLFPTVIDVADRLSDTLVELCTDNAEMEMKDLMARFTTDVIGSCAFGIECNSLKDPNVDFRRYGRMVFEKPHLNQAMRAMVTFYPELCRKFNVSIMGDDVNRFFHELVRDTIAYREENNIRRNDFMELLIQMKNDPNTKLTLAEIVAQAFIFFAAGFDTSSSALTFAIYELAMNSEIQERARREIEEVLQKHDGKLSYESIKEMEYLDWIINESLRKYPPVFVLLRKSAQDYPVASTTITIEKDTLLLVPVYAIHHDPEIYPNPELFDPDRFAPDNVKSRHPIAFVGFGDGPRNCVGLRFARMEGRIGLVTLLRKFRFEPCPRTQTRMEFDKNSMLLTPKGGMYLRVERILV